MNDEEATITFVCEDVQYAPRIYVGPVVDGVMSTIDEEADPPKTGKLTWPPEAY